MKILEKILAAFSKTSEDLEELIAASQAETPAEETPAEETPAEAVTEEAPAEAVETTVEEMAAPAEQPAPDTSNVKTYAESEIKVSSKEFGGKVELVDSEGNLSDFPDGDFMIEGDDNVYTASQGQISAINGESAPAEQPAQEQPAAPVEAPVEAPAQPEQPQGDEKARIDSLEAEVAALKEQIAQLLAASQNMAKQEDFNAVKKGLDSINEKLNVLATTPAEFSKTNSSAITKDSNSKSQGKLKHAFGCK